MSDMHPAARWRCWHLHPLLLLQDDYSTAAAHRMAGCPPAVAASRARTAAPSAARKGEHNEDGGTVENENKEAAIQRRNEEEEDGEKRTQRLRCAQHKWGVVDGDVDGDAGDNTRLSLARYGIDGHNQHWLAPLLVTFALVVVMLLKQQHLDRDQRPVDKHKWGDNVNPHQQQETKKIEDKLCIETKQRPPLSLSLSAKAHLQIRRFCDHLAALGIGKCQHRLHLPRNVLLPLLFLMHYQRRVSSDRAGRRACRTVGL